MLLFQYSLAMLIIFSAEHICETLQSAVLEWNLLSHHGPPPVVYDNATNMVKAVSLFKSALGHKEFCPHIEPSSSEVSDS